MHGKNNKQEKMGRNPLITDDYGIENITYGLRMKNKYMFLQKITAFVHLLRCQRDVVCHTEFLVIRDLF